MKASRSLGMAGLAIAATTALAACSASPASSTSGSGTGTSVQQQARTVWLGYARCVRAHGYPDFPDPQVDADGSATIVGGPQAKQAAQASAVRSACAAILGRLPASVTGQQPVTAATLRTERLLAACLRRHGLPAWPDPRPDGTFPLSGTPYAGRGKSGPVGAALAACRQYAVGGVRAS
jgi:hypothetical protein